MPLVPDIASEPFLKLLSCFAEGEPQRYLTQRFTEFDPMPRAHLEAGFQAPTGRQVGSNLLPEGEMLDEAFYRLRGHLLDARNTNRWPIEQRTQLLGEVIELTPRSQYISLGERDGLRRLVGHLEACFEAPTGRQVRPNLLSEGQMLRAVRFALGARGSGFPDELFTDRLGDP